MAASFLCPLALCAFKSAVGLSVLWVEGSFWAVGKYIKIYIFYFFPGQPWITFVLCLCILPVPILRLTSQGRSLRLYRVTYVLCCGLLLDTGVLFPSIHHVILSLKVRQIYLDFWIVIPSWGSELSKGIFKSFLNLQLSSHWLLVSPSYIKTEDGIWEAAQQLCCNSILEEFSIWLRRVHTSPTYT